VSNRIYAIAWNDIRNDLEDKMNLNENTDAYCDVVNASFRSAGYGNSVYPTGVTDCICWFKENRTLPPRLSWTDKNKPLNDINGSISAQEMRAKILASRSLQV